VFVAKYPPGFVLLSHTLLLICSRDLLVYQASRTVVETLIFSNIQIFHGRFSAAAISACRTATVTVTEEFVVRPLQLVRWRIT